MKGNVKGRILAWVLTIMMVVSYMPQIAFATDTAVTPNTAQTEATHDHDHEATTAAETAESSDASETESSGGTEQESEVETKEPAEDSTAVTEPSEESTKAETKEPVQEEQTRVERAVELAGIVVDGFGLTADMTNDEIADAIQTANVDDATGNAVNELMALAESATRDEYKEAIKYDDVKLFERFYYVLEKMNTPETVASLNEEVISGVTVSTSDADSASASNGVVTIKRSGSTTSGCSSKDETRTTTVTITSTAVGSILSFGWEMTSGSLTINGSAASGSSFSQEITANPTTVKLVYTSPAGKNNTGTLTLKDFSLISDNQTFKVTVQNESSLGSVKAAGNTLTGESTVFDAVSSKDGIELVATPNSGATFLGWIDANPDNKDTYGTILSTAQTYVLKPTHDIIVMPAFAAPTAPAWFGVGSSYLYNDLNKANEKAASTTKVIVPVKDGVLEAGDYTISSGVTLLIPFDANNTLYTDEPGDAGESVTTTSAFRTLTMADGAKITVNGAISVGGRQATGQKFNGLISGAYGHIKMLSGSDIVVKSGGFLYAWGFVSGAGEVEILSGATVYESFQVRDWRGGSFASSFLDNEQKIFPLSQYYVQNVEVPMKIHSGATEYGFTSVAVTLLGTQTSKVPFIGPSGTLFNINEGYIIKDYDEAQDRLVIESHNADVTMDAISLSMQVSIISNLKFNSANYVLPITNNITVNVLEGSSVTITQDIAFLPGSEFYVDETSYCSVKNDKSVFIYDYDQWGGYCSPDDLEYMQLLNVQGGAPKARTLKDASLCVDGTVDASEGYIYVTTKEAGDASEFANIYSTGNGVIICRDGDAECTYQVKQESTSVEAIVAIPVAPAYLKNADGSFASTIVDGTVRTFKYVNGKWHTLHEVPAYDATCLESGSKEDHFKCLTCKEGELYKDKNFTAYPAGETPIIDPLGHDEVTHEAKAVTCTEDGWDAYVTCTRCDYTTYKVQTALGHAWVDADCFNPKTCSRCKLTDGKPLDHIIELVEAKDPACAEEGNEEHYKCTLCETCYIDANGDYEMPKELVTIPALGHKGKKVAAVEATCTTAGNIEHYKCTVCDAFLVDKEGTQELTEGEVIIDALNHYEVNHEAKAPTCTEYGWDAYVTCNRCDYTTYEKKAALGHDKVSHEAKAETCTEPGWKAYVACSRCDYTTKVEIPKLGHDEVSHEAKAETCTEPGWDAYVTCNRCDYTTKVEIPALDHDKVSHEAKEETCEEPGWEAYESCSRCDYTTKVEIPALGHDEVPHDAKAVTCEEDGWDAYVTCNRCDYTTKEVITALGHDEVTHEAKDPTCTEIGWEPHVTCSRCDYTTIVKIPALGHKFTKVEAIKKTCTTDGRIEYYDCSVCGGLYTDEKGENEITQEETVVPASHELNETEIDPPTCTEMGYAARTTCKECDYVEESNLLEPLGHTAEEWNIDVLATCTKDGYKTAKCDRCGDSMGEDIPATGHSIEAVEAADPTCTETGNKAHFKCTACEELFLNAEGTEKTTIEEMTIAATGHTTEAVEAADPTCTETGNKAHYICTVCEDLFLDAEAEEPTTAEEMTIAATGHDTEAVEATDPTCTETGNKAYFKCTVCDGLSLDKDGKETTTIEEVTIAATGHNTELVVAKEASCTDGNKEHYKCTVCSELFLDAEAEEPTTAEEMTIAGNGHTTEPVAAADPTCTETGNKAHYRCTVCEELFLDAEADIPTTAEEMTIAAAGHAPEYVEEKAAACTETGYEEHYKCPACGELFLDAEADIPTTIEDLTIAATGHNAKSVAAADPTCTEAGNKAHFKCSACSELFLDAEAEEPTTAEEMTIAATGHTTEAVEAKDPTCTAKGNKAHYICTVCEELFLNAEGTEGTTAEDVTIAATGHAITAVTAVAATCTEAGIKAHYVCGTCEKLFADANGRFEIAESDTVDPARGHETEVVAAVDPTCTETGNAAHYICTVCEDLFMDKAGTDATTIEEVTIDALGHDEVSHEAVAPTCTETGLDAYVTCSRCDYTTKAVKDALGHDEVSHDAKAPTCTEAGWDAYVTCSRCDYTTKTEIGATGHDEVTHEAVAPTCTEAGWDAYVTCSRCDYTTKVEKEALGHNEVTHEAKAPTCTEIGWDAFVTCDRCDYSTYEAKDALGHEWNADAETGELIYTVDVAPKCTTIGYESVYCTRDNCDASKDTREIAATGHTFTEWYETEPTSCNKDGGEKRDCINCNYYETNILDMLGHDKVAHEGKEATCEEGGWLEYETCSRCDWTSYKETAPLGHAVKEYDGQKATCTEIGWEAYEECTRCDYTTYAEIAATGHTAVTDNAVAATCTEAGKTEGSHCLVCGEILKQQLAIDPTGHTSVIVKAEPATCTEAGKTAGISCSVCNEVLVAQKPVAATGHTAVTDKAVAATCTTDGLTEGSHCETCGEVITAQETVKATGHSAVTDKAVAPTCTTDGLTEGSHCETCGEVITAQETVAATGHSYGEWTVVEATCTEEGTQTKSCANCDDVVTETIEAPGHKYGEEQYQIPTEKESGGHYKACDVCEDMIWTAPQSYSAYVKAGVEATTLKVAAAGSVKTETITVKWTNSSDAEVEYYKVYRSTTGKTGTFNYIGKSTGKSYEDKKATVGKTYYYKVIGYKELDGETFKTKTSSAASAKIKKVTAAQVKATPMKATTNYVDRGLKLEWTSPNIKVDGYEIQRSTTRNGTYKVVKTTKAGARSWTNKGLKVGKRYFFKVRGFKYVNGKKVYTKFSSKGYRYVLKGNDAKLAAAIVRADAVTAKSAVKVSGGIKVTWSKKSSIKCNKYTVWRATSKNGTYTKIATTKNKYYTDKKAKAGKTYYYKIKGQRTFGKSKAVTNYSNVVSGKR